MSNKKITELPIASTVNASDVSILVNNGTHHQFAFSSLLQLIGSSLNIGADISFGTTLPQNTTGKNGDVFINTNTATFAQKTTGTWTIVYTLPSSGSTTDGTILYGIGVPGSSTGNNNDTYINTATGIFYKKTADTWSQAFSMQTGPAGAAGPAGTNGTNGSNGFSVLNGTTTPSNLSTGVNGDFYINTTTYTLFGPKTAGNWGTGVSLIGNGVPLGGTTGQIMSKASDDNLDIEWSDKFAGLSDNIITNALGYDPENIENKGMANGYAGLDGSGKVPSSQLPSYVDDVIEAATYSALPSIGEVGKIYVTTNNNKAFRWAGSVYVEIVPSPGSTDAIPEGSVNKYYTDARVAAYGNANYLGLHATADNAALWNGQPFINGLGTSQQYGLAYDNVAGAWRSQTAANWAAWMGLGSYAYRSAGLAELTGASFSGDITTYRSATPHIGVLILNQNGTKYLVNDGTKFDFVGGNLFAPNLSGTNTGDETTTRINALYGYTPANGANYLPLIAGSGNPLSGDLYQGGSDVTHFLGSGANKVAIKGSSGSFYLYTGTSSHTLALTIGSDLKTVFNGPVTIGETTFTGRALSATANNADYGFTFKQDHTGGGGIQIFTSNATFGGNPLIVQDGTNTKFLVTNAGDTYANSFTGLGTGLNGTATALNIGGNAATATTASNAIALGGISAMGGIAETPLYIYTYDNVTGSQRFMNATGARDFLSLGSYATRSVGLAELSGANFTGEITTKATGNSNWAMKFLRHSDNAIMGGFYQSNSGAGRMVLNNASAQGLVDIDGSSGNAAFAGNLSIGGGGTFGNTVYASRATSENTYFFEGYNSHASNNGAAGYFHNAGGTLIWGVERSVGGAYITGLSGYGGFIGTGIATDFGIGTNSAIRLLFNGTTGAAIFSSTIQASNLSGTNTGDNAINTTSNAYADDKVANNMTASTTVAPSKSSVISYVASVVASGGVPAGTPTITLGPAAGTGATCYIQGDNRKGLIQIYTGASPVQGNIIFTLTFAGGLSYPEAIISLITPAENMAASVYSKTFVYPTAGNHFDYNIVIGQQLTASEAYFYYYDISGY